MTRTGFVAVGLLSGLIAAVALLGGAWWLTRRLSPETVSALGPEGRRRIKIAGVMLTVVLVLFGVALGSVLPAH